ncbi:MAG: hypothetical protein CMM87_00460 [Rickettsiales bacterium]|nr:hypothetical protein [Rickettsiales bacterium]|tara:strand:- start:92278 stop:95187 length:2910 start_codon:yes stop_codon:yes gene_type:complete
MTRSPITSSQLYSLAGLKEIHQQFQTVCQNTNSDKEIVFEKFLPTVFGIGDSYQELKNRYLSETRLSTFRVKFIQRFILRKDKPTVLPHLPQILKSSPYKANAIPSLFDFATFILNLDETQWPAWSIAFTQFMLYPELRSDHFNAPSWRFLDKSIEPLSQKESGLYTQSPERQRLRTGFNHTDPVQPSSYAQEEAGYCLKCHKRHKDSCRKGLSTPLTSVDDLPGCPLDQKISEMFEQIESGNLLTALALIMVDNPLVALTGHRICNDCQKSCIFQNQTAVDIPQAETRLLLDVLGLPYGFEIYSLLTRWNPFHPQPLPKQPNNKSIAIVGLGPAGVGLAHEMLRKGYQTMLFEGLKIDPIPQHLIGSNHAFDLIKEWSSLTQNLENRTIKGFGGVAEYGITARWDKNFLTLVRIILERNTSYHYTDGVRIGKTLSIQDLFDRGFDHVSLCTGAGKPKNLPNTDLPKGVRMGVDFLMGLHQRPLPDVFLQNPIQLPTYVYGAGLTAIDTATEVLAAYPVQVAAIAKAAATNSKKIKHIPKPILETFLDHAHQLAQAKAPTEQKQLLQKWGGVTVLYHRDLPQAPSYRQSRHELANALSEGIQIRDQISLVSWHKTQDQLQSITVLDHLTNQHKTLPTHNLFLALGTKPNFNALKDINSQSIQWLTANQAHQTPTKNPKDPQPFFIQFLGDTHAISALGDLHPTYEGSVVKALASAKYAAPQIDQLLHKSNSKPVNLRKFTQSFQARLTDLQQIAPDQVLVTIQALEHLKNYQLGHFYKIQCYPNSTHTFLKGQAISPFDINPQTGTFKAIIKGSRQSKDLEQIYLMGPVGAPLQLSPSAQVQVVTANTDYYLLSLTKTLASRNQLASYTVQKSDTDQTNLFDLFFPTAPQTTATPITDLLISGTHLTYEIATRAQQKNIRIHQKMGGPLQCMMGGICAHCLKPNPASPGQWLYACQGQFINFTQTSGHL